MFGIGRAGKEKRKEGEKGPYGLASTDVHSFTRLCSRQTDKKKEGRNSIMQSHNRRRCMATHDEVEIPVLLDPLVFGLDHEM